MAYDKSLVAKLTARIVDDLDADVQKMISCSTREEAQGYAHELNRKSSDNFVRNMNDESSSQVLSHEEQAYLNSFGVDIVADADYIELESMPVGISKKETGVGFLNTDGRQSFMSGFSDGASAGSSSSVGGDKSFTGGTSDRVNLFKEKRMNSRQAPPSDEDMNRFRDLGKKFARAKQQEADNVYFSGATAKERANPSYDEIFKRFHEKSQHEKYMKAAAQNKRNDERQRKMEQTLYKSCVLTDYAGSEKQYKVVKRKCNLTMNDFIENDPMYNIAVLRKALTDEVLRLVGDWSRIKDIYVRSEQLIVNGVQCIPVIPSQVRGSLPFDTAELIENGCFASIFNWNSLRYMKNLFCLDIDDEYLFRTTISDDLKLSRSIGVKSLLKFCPRMEHCIVNGVDLCSPDDSEEVVVAKRSLARGKHFDNMFDGFQFDLYAGTGSIRSWTANNFREYANSRGNKGLLQYCGGMFTRGLVGIAGFVPDAVAHVVGGFFKAAGSLFKAATTPVE